MKKLNLLYAEFYLLVDEKMSIEKLEKLSDVKYEVRVNMINQLTIDIESLRDQIKNFTKLALYKQ